MASAVLFVQHPAESQAQSTATYTVKWGDSLWKISKRYQIGLSEIINANPQIANPDLIYPGQKVTVPLKKQVKSIEQQVIDLTNQERTSRGLPALKEDWQLSRVARYKARDMASNGYFSHTSPTYGSPFQMMSDFNISYRSAAENIAAGQRTAQEVVNGWMNSSGHRKNILNRNLTHIGVGYAKGGSYGTYWSQMFISK
ncbi:SafA/ExsA family spore coat assembly protein [Halobacillus salinarum]|uniref:SafA/ExsA family spore coat assembly protein n=1 Tax=Halobacillus salinarum TaxID=2932257 RepID=A0ABY4ES16_9BACI|nr:SafA/ExsA family spore coat assembly protein [Halobacillus salinarum]UOQ46517.1 SafA/ExsA family spore coat assembly protein [Halobacillus salinarum]